MTVVTVGLLPADAAPLAADLLADRQRRFRDAWQAAAPSFESSSRCLALLEPLVREGDAFGCMERVPSRRLRRRNLSREMGGHSCRRARRR